MYTTYWMFAMFYTTSPEPARWIDWHPYRSRVGLLFNDHGKYLSNVTWVWCERLTLHGSSSREVGFITLTWFCFVSHMTLDSSRLWINLSTRDMYGLFMCVLLSETEWNMPIKTFSNLIELLIKFNIKQRVLLVVLKVNAAAIYDPSPTSTCPNKLETISRHLLYRP